MKKLIITYHNYEDDSRKLENLGFKPWHNIIIVSVTTFTIGTSLEGSYSA